jgi:transcriptional regulator with XRE-family HTH domain
VTKGVRQMLRHLREQRGLTQAELARRARITQAYVAKLEAGEKIPSLATVQRLARVLGVSVDTLTLNKEAPMSMVTVKLIADGKQVVFPGVSRIESKAHRLELYGPGPSDPLAEFDKADVATWYAEPHIRISDEAGRIPATKDMRLMLSDRPTDAWAERLRERADATEEGRALKLRVDASTLVFECADRADLRQKRMLIGELLDQMP